MSPNFVRCTLCAALAALSAAAFTFASSAATAASPKPPRVQLHATALGKILATNSGFTLYVFTRDRRNRDTCLGIHGCSSVWPVLRTNRKPLAGKGLKASLLGTIPIGHGARQVTYNGHPLYRYVADSSPGQTDYVGVRQFGGTWYAINALGKVVK